MTDISVANGGDDQSRDKSDIEDLADDVRIQAQARMLFAESTEESDIALSAAERREVEELSTFMGLLQENMVMSSMSGTSDPKTSQSTLVVPRQRDGDQRLWSRWGSRALLAAAVVLAALVSWRAVDHTSPRAHAPGHAPADDAALLVHLSPTAGDTSDINAHATLVGGLTYNELWQGLDADMLRLQRRASRLAGPAPAARSARAPAPTFPTLSTTSPRRYEFHSSSRSFSFGGSQ